MVAQIEVLGFSILPTENGYEGGLFSVSGDKAEDRRAVKSTVVSKTYADLKNKMDKQGKIMSEAMLLAYVGDLDKSPIYKLCVSKGTNSVYLVNIKDELGIKVYVSTNGKIARSKEHAYIGPTHMEGVVGMVLKHGVSGLGLEGRILDEIETVHEWGRWLK